MKKLLCIIMSLVFICNLVYAQTEKKESPKKQFVYILKLNEKYFDEKNWTDADMKIVGEHFARLQQMLSGGSLILAGRTDVENSKTLGLVIYEEESFEKAKEVAEADPAVKAGIMKVEVYPYNVALIRK